MVGTRDGDPGYRISDATRLLRRVNGQGFVCVH